MNDCLVYQRFRLTVFFRKYAALFLRAVAETLFFVWNWERVGQVAGVLGLAVLVRMHFEKMPEVLVLLNEAHAVGVVLFAVGYGVMIQAQFREMVGFKGQAKVC